MQEGDVAHDGLQHLPVMGYLHMHRRAHRSWPSEVDHQKLAFRNMPTGRDSPNPSFLLLVWPDPHSLHLDFLEIN